MQWWIRKDLLKCKDNTMSFLVIKDNTISSDGYDVYA